MAVKIRLQRKGRKKKPYYHIVVADARAPRDGRYIDRLGSYNPMTSPATIEIDEMEAYQWLGKGAQPTDTVRAILRFKGVMYLKHLMRGVKKGAMSEEDALKKWKEWKDAKEQKISERFEETKKEKEEYLARVFGEVPKPKVEEVVADEDSAETPEEASAPETENVKEEDTAESEEMPKAEEEEQAPGEAEPAKATEEEQAS